MSLLNRNRLVAHSTVAGIVVVVVISTVHAQQPSTTAPSKPTIRQADVFTDASRVYVFVDKTGFGHQHGVEARLLPSTLALGATSDAGKLVFDMSSFKADTSAARKYVGLTGDTDSGTQTAVTANMLGSNVLDVDRYPTATFDIRSANAVGKAGPSGLPTYLLEGNFILHGTTKPLKVTVEAEQTRGWLHLRGNFTILQTAFGITPFSKAFGAIGVSDELRIYGDLYVAPSKHIVMSDIPTRR